MNIENNPLRIYRNKRFWSQAYLARILKVKKQNVNAWESGINVPTTINFDIINKVTGITWEEWKEWMKKS